MAEIPSLASLSRREREVVSLIGRGLNSRRIAECLGVTYFTVRKHRSNILSKLQLHSAAQLAAYAAQMSTFEIHLDPTFMTRGLA